MSNHFASASDTFVKASATTPDEVNIEHAMANARQSNTGVIAQASTEIHGLPATGHKA